MKTVKKRCAVGNAFVHGIDAKYRAWDRRFVSAHGLYYYNTFSCWSGTKFMIARRFNVYNGVVIITEPEDDACSVGTVRHCVQEIEGVSSIPGVRVIIVPLYIYEDSDTLGDHIERTMRRSLAPGINLNKKGDRDPVLNMAKSIDKLIKHNYVDKAELDPVLYNEFKNKVTQAEFIQQKRSRKKK